MILAWLACRPVAVVDTDAVDTEVTEVVDTEVVDTEVVDTDLDTDPGDTDLVDPGPWRVGDPIASLPRLADLSPLPGGAAGVPVFTSNNPEKFTSTGWLLQNARRDDVRGGATSPLSGDWGVFVHHVNDSGADRVVHLLVTNPGAAAITVSGAGSVYTNSERPLGRGTGPDYAAMDDLLRDAPRTTVPTTSVAPSKAASVWHTTLKKGAYLDGWLRLTTSDIAYAYVIVADSDDPNAAVALSRTAATGDIRTPGDPPPPYGREGGIYAADTWEGAWTLSVPAAGQWAGYAVNTATGLGYPQIQAFPAVLALDDSAQEAVGMYGNTYELTVILAPGPGSAANVDVYLASLGSGSPSSWWNGPVAVDGDVIPVWLAPDARAQRVATVPTADAARAVQLRLPVPGLSAIPQALLFVTR